MGTVEAFLRFPQEVWEVLLGNVNDPIDIAHVFQAYPELQREGVLKSQRHVYLFAQVLPHIFPRLKKKQILACRQVCQQWCRGVDNFLENHPSRRPYPAGNQTELVGQHWTLRASPFHYNIKKYWHGLKIFSGTVMFNQFLLDMGSHPPDRNPFIGRSVTVNDYWTGKDREWSPRAGIFWETFLDFLAMFGRHIWFLTIQYNKTFQIHFTQVIIQSLKLLPNLKSLNIVFGVERKFRSTGSRPLEDFLESRTGRVPPIAQLETLNVSDEYLPPLLVRYLIMSYSSQLRRLSIHHCHWRKEYSELLPNLTEFSLWGCATNDQVLEILHSLKSKMLRLYELEIIPDPKYSDDFHRLLQNVSKFLPHFPNITSLTIIDPCERHRMKYERDPDEIVDESQNTKRWKWTYHNEKSSLRSLLIYTGDNLQFNPKLFKYFPQLVYFKLKASSTNDELTGYKGMKKRMKWKAIANSTNLWEVLLPKLRAATIAYYENYYCDCCYVPRRMIYDRGSYEEYQRTTKVPIAEQYQHRSTSSGDLSRLPDDEWFDSMHESESTDEEEGEWESNDFMLSPTLHRHEICCPYERFS